MIRHRPVAELGLRTVAAALLQRAAPGVLAALASLGFIGTVQAAGDAQRGEQVYESRCGGCHAVGADRVGPRHAGVFGRRAGSVKGFDYSDALAKSRIVWDEGTLTRWLANPEALVPGQRMGFQLGDAGERADVVAYLRTLKP